MEKLVRPSIANMPNSLLCESIPRASIKHNKVVMPAPISGVYVRLVVWQHGADAKWVAHGNNTNLRGLLPRAVGSVYRVIARSHIRITTRRMSTTS